MKRQLIYNNITDLLINREWKRKEIKTKYDVFVPPSRLNFSETYRLYVYNKFEKSDFEKMITNILRILAQIYKEDIDELVSIIIDDRQILSLHIKNENIKNARPNISFFDKLIHNSKELLQETANFSVLKKQHFYDNSDEAERYLNYCNFFKNDTGSLITKIQLPNKEEIKLKNIFDTGIAGYEINKNLINVTEFINNDILASENFKPDKKFLISNKNLISVNISNKLKSLYAGIEYADIEFSLKSTKINKTTKAEKLNKKKVDNLNIFSNTVRKAMRDISENKVSGKIIQLKSQNVDNDKNLIIVKGYVKNIMSQISISLNSKQIKLAAEAFKNNKSVSITGTLEKEKSQYKVIELQEFNFI